MLSKVGGVINLTPLHKSNLKINPMELDKFDIYQQLSYLCKICDESGVGKIKNIITQSSKKLNMDDLKKIVSLLIKSFRLRLSKNKTISNTEKEELKILETISDIWGGVSSKDTLDNFV